MTGIKTRGRSITLLAAAGALLSARGSIRNRSTSTALSPLPMFTVMTSRISTCVRWEKNLLQRNRGDSYATQNNAMLLIGLGGAESADSVHVNWASGRTREIGGPITAEREFIVREGPEQPASVRADQRAGLHHQFPCLASQIPNDHPYCHSTCMGRPPLPPG